ncbi:MAG: aminotransferase class V-fold PLP-dependent enzyme, partial [Clostridia bacterium]|nr:aminotransferase class V-fold PLP-dependent enzyme [Clostridia bacterium]
LRSGTENTLGIASFGAAAAEDMTGVKEHFHALYTTALEALGNIEGVTLNLPEKPSESLVNISLAGYRSEIILHALSSEGIFVSSGSACSSKKGTSPVLKAFGLDSRHADGALRISFSRYNTTDEIHTLALALERTMKNISKR